MQCNPISTLGDFEILSELGKGSFGFVYKVFRKKDSKIYAMKRVSLSKLNPKERENALNEIRLLASIVNPYIIEYKDAFYDSLSNSLCLVMEYAECGDLEKKIEQKTKSKASFSEIEVISIISQIIRGLKALHNAKVIHRDLKAANIFLFKENLIKIGDLNVSKSITKAFKHTQTGTPYYASPEVWDNRPYDYKSDIWSLGCLLYEICALRAPFRGTSIKMVYDKVKKVQYDPLPKLYSEKVSCLVQMCLQAEPVKRPSCKQLLSIINDETNLFNSNRLMIHSPKIAHPLSLGRNAPIDLKESRTQDDYEQRNHDLLKTIKMPKKLFEINKILPKKNYGTRKIKSAYYIFSKLPQLLKSNLKAINNKKEFIPLLKSNNSTANVKPKDCLKNNSPLPNSNIIEVKSKEDIQLPTSLHLSINDHKGDKPKEPNGKVPFIKKSKKASADLNTRPDNNCPRMRRKILQKEMNDNNITFEINNISTNNKTVDPRIAIREIQRDITQVEEIINNISKASPEEKLPRRIHPHNEFNRNVRLFSALLQKERNVHSLSMNQNKELLFSNKKIHSLNTNQPYDNKVKRKEKSVSYNNNYLPSIDQEKLLPTAPSLLANDKYNTHSKQLSLCYEHSFDTNADSQKRTLQVNNNPIQPLLISKQKSRNVPIKLNRLPFDNQINFESNITIAKEVNKIIKGYKIIANCS